MISLVTTSVLLTVLYAFASYRNADPLLTAGLVASVLILNGFACIALLKRIYERRRIPAEVKDVHQSERRMFLTNSPIADLGLMAGSIASGLMLASGLLLLLLGGLTLVAQWIK